MKVFLSLLFLTLMPCVFAQSPLLKTVVQQGHTAAVKVSVQSPNQLWVATGSRDKTIKLWDLATGYELSTLYGHTSTVNDLQFSADNVYLASSSADHTVALWTVADGKKIWQSPDHQKYATTVAISPNVKWLAYGGYFDSVYVVSIPSGKRIAAIPSNADQGSGYGIDLQFSPDSKFLAMGEDNKTATLIHTSNWSTYAVSSPEKGWCGGCGTLVSFSNDSKFLYKMSHNDSVQQYNIALKKTTQYYGAEVDEMYGVYVNGANQLVVANDTTLTVYDVSTAKIISKVNTSTWQVQSIHPAGTEGSWVAQSNCKASVYHQVSGAQIKVLEGFAQQLDKGSLDYDPENYWQRHIANYIKYKNTCLLNADENTIYTGKIGSQCIGWNIATGAPVVHLKEHTKAVLAMDRSADGKWLVTADGAGTLMIREASTGRVLHTIAAHREPIFAVKINPNGTQIATASWDATVKLWNVESGVLEQNIYFENNSVYTLAYTPDGLYLVVGQMDNTLALIEPDSKSVVRTFIGHTGIVSSIRFGKDRNQLFTTSWDGSARSWELSTGMQLQKFKMSQGKVHAGVFYKNNTQVITAGEDRVIRVWNVGDGKLLFQLIGHTSEITDLQITNDNALLYSYSIDGEIKCWNMNTQKEVYAHVHLSAKDWMATTPAGYFVATEGARKNIHFTKGLEVYNTDQFFDQFYQPDLIQKSILNRGLNTTGQTLQGAIEKYPTPTVKLASSLSDDGLFAHVSIKLINNGGGIKNLKLYHNGKHIVLNVDTSTFPKTMGEVVVYKQMVPLVKGQNHFSATAQNIVGLESAEVSSLLFSDKAPHAAKCHVLVLGVNNYTNPIYQLNFARQDAEAFVQQLKKESGDLFDEVLVHALYDQQVTKKNILDTFTVLQKSISYNDVFVFYYAGHGAMVEGAYYFITANCVRAYEKTTLDAFAFSAVEMQEQLSLIKALKQVIIIDACQSGGSVEVLAMRGVSEEKAFAQLSRSAGIHVMAAAASDQAAKEVLELKHGLFTYVLLKGMMGDADGAPKDGKITVFELKSYMDDQVPEWSSKYGSKAQYPYTFSRGSDFPMLLK